MARTRLDALLVERGLFESRSSAAAAVMAGEVQAGRGRPAGRQAGPARAERRRRCRRRRARRFVSRGGQSSRTRSTPLGIDPPGARCPRRRRLHRRLHRLPAPARRRARGGARRRLRRAPLAHPQRPARDRARADQRARPRAVAPALPARPDRGGRVVHLARKVLPAVLACARRALRLPGARQAAVRGRPRAGGQGRRGALPRRPPFGAGGRGRASPRELGRSLLGYASSGLPGPAGNRETFAWIAEPGRAGARAKMSRRPRARSSREPAAGRHDPHPPDPRGDDRGLHVAIDRLVDAGVEVRLPPDEVRSTAIEPRDGVVLGSHPEDNGAISPSCWAATARLCRDAHLRRARRARLLLQLRRRSASWPRSSGRARGRHPSA